METVTKAKGTVSSCTVPSSALTFNKVYVVLKLFLAMSHDVVSAARGGVDVTGTRWWVPVLGMVPSAHRRAKCSALRPPQHCPVCPVPRAVLVPGALLVPAAVPVPCIWCSPNAQCHALRPVLCPVQSRCHAPCLVQSQ